MIVVPGLYMGECTHGGRVWMVADGITCVLIDTGAPDGTLGVGELIQSAGRRPHEVRLILLTHHHRNHAGNAAELRVLTGAPLAASAATAAAVAQPSPPRRRRLAGPFAPEPVRPAHVDRVLQPGELIDLAGGIEVIDAPGHTPGGLAFHVRRLDALLAGDAVGLERGRITAPPARHCDDPEQAARTAAALAGRGARVVAPGHGYAVVEGRAPQPTLSRVAGREAWRRAVRGRAGLDPAEPEPPRA